MLLWLQFIICAVLIFISGYRLSRSATIISGKGVFSAGLMGVLFLSVITSCPELFTALGSVTVVTAPDMAMGDLIGSVIVNIAAVAVFAFFYKSKGKLLNRQSKTNIFTGMLTILMLGLIMGNIGMRSILNLKFGVFNIGFDSIVLALVYIAGVILIYRHETGKATPAVKEKIGLSLYLGFAAASIVIIFSSFWLAHIGKSIADFYGWNEMLIGLVLIAITTSMPEFVVSLAALKLGSSEMALGNILGSNFFNLFVIPVLDIFFRKGQILSFVSVSNIYPLFIAVVLTSLVVGLMLRGRK